jgi:hypothetical protein
LQPFTGKAQNKKYVFTVTWPTLIFFYSRPKHFLFGNWKVSWKFVSLKIEKYYNISMNEEYTICSNFARLYRTFQCLCRLFFITTSYYLYQILHPTTGIFSSNLILALLVVILVMLKIIHANKIFTAFITRTRYH